MQFGAVLSAGLLLLATSAGAAPVSQDVNGLLVQTSRPAKDLAGC